MFIQILLHDNQMVIRNFICSIEAFEEYVTCLVEQEIFTNFTYVGDDVIFVAEFVSNLITYVRMYGAC